MRQVGIYINAGGVATAILRGIADYAHEHGQWRNFWHAMLTSQMLAQGGPSRFDGIITHIHSESMAQRVREIGLRVVNVSNTVRLPGIPTVVANQEMIGRMGADHLCQTGLRHFAVGTSNYHAGMTLRSETFRQVIEARGHTCVALPASFGWTADSQREDQLDQDLLRSLPKPIGILACNDTQAAAIIDLCTLLRLRVPHDVAVVGIDNAFEISQLCEPQITSIDVGGQRIGYEAARLLDQLMDGKPAPARPIRVDPIRLIRRGSTDVLVTSDQDVTAAIQFIRARAAERLEVRDVLDHVNLSRRTLERRFRKHLGRSIHQEIMNARLLRAQDLLMDTPHSIARIASMCGFASQGYFTRALRLQTGKTPGQWRKGRHG